MVGGREEKDGRREDRGGMNGGRKAMRNVAGWREIGEREG